MDTEDSASVVRSVQFGVYDDVEKASLSNVVRVLASRSTLLTDLMNVPTSNSGSVVCNACSPSRQNIPHINSKRKQRICNDCLEKPPRQSLRSFSEHSISLDSVRSDTSSTLRLQSFSTSNATTLSQQQQSSLYRPKSIKRAQSAIRSSISSRKDIAGKR